MKIILLLILVIGLHVKGLTNKQHTYYGLKFGCISPRKHYLAPGVKNNFTYPLYYGVLAGISFREQIVKNVTFNQGYSFRAYETVFELKDGSEVFIGNAYAYHNVSLQCNYELNLVKDKLIGFVTLGGDIGFNEDGKHDNYFSGFIINPQDDDKWTSTQWKRVNPALIDVFYIAGYGCRLNLKGELQLELTVEYNFRFKDLRSYSTTLNSDEGVIASYSFSEKGDYFSTALGIYYSFQKTAEFFKNGLNKLNGL